MLECKVFDWRFTYLGLPLGGNPKAIGSNGRLNFARLDGWKKKTIPSYFLLLYKISLAIVSKIEKM